MHVLFDIVHPAHVHFFRNIIRGLRRRSHSTFILARDKEVTTSLLDHYGFEYETIGRPSRRGRAGQLVELVRRDAALWRMTRRVGAEVIVTRNPAGVQAARLAGVVGIFDTDDGEAAGVHFSAAAPFAHHITSPDCLPEDWGPRHVRYAGYKQSAYLHPDHFKPDPTVLDALGVARNETFFLVRFVAMHASHDHGEGGMPYDAKREVIRRLRKQGRVFLSCESEVPSEWSDLALRLPSHRLHDALAFASLLVGDSQTMTAEAAVLGTPSIRCSTFAGRIAYLEELEHRYGLTSAYHPRDTSAALAALDSLLELGDRRRASIAEGHMRMLGDKINVADWYVSFIEHCAPRARRTGGG